MGSGSFFKIEVRAMDNIYRLIIGILAVWRITHLLQAEDGPWDMVVGLRRFAGNGFWGKLLDCFKCLSLWVSLPAALLLGVEWMEKTILWLAFSGGAILLEQIAGRESASTTAIYYEEKENDNGKNKTQIT